MTLRAVRRPGLPAIAVLMPATQDLRTRSARTHALRRAGTSRGRKERYAAWSDACNSSRNALLRSTCRVAAPSSPFAPGLDPLVV
jgi:hypothetical protein